MNFSDALVFILSKEAGYVNHPKDPGGETNMGISKKQYPDLDIKNLTQAKAAEIYRRDYWDKLKLDTFPAPIRLALFDTAVNSGCSTAIKCLQQAVQTEPDGIVGPETLRKAQAAFNANPKKLVADVLFWRYRKLVTLDTFPTFGNGWVHRIMEVIAHSV